MRQRETCSKHRIVNCNICYLANYRSKIETREVPESDSDSTLMDVFIPAPNPPVNNNCDDSTNDFITTGDVPQPCPQPCPQPNLCDGVLKCFNEPCSNELITFMNVATNTTSSSYISAAVATNNQNIWLATNPNTTSLNLTLYNPQTFTSSVSTFTPATYTVDSIQKISVSTGSTALILVKGGDISTTSYLVYYTGGSLYQLGFPSSPGYNPVDVSWSSDNNYFSVVLESAGQVLVGITNNITISGTSASATLLTLPLFTPSSGGSVVANINSSNLYVCDIEPVNNIATLYKYTYNVSAITPVDYTTAGLNLTVPYNQWSVIKNQLSIGSKPVVAYTVSNLITSQSSVIIFGTNTQITTKLTNIFVPFSLAISACGNYYVLALTSSGNVQLNVYSMETSVLLSTLNANNLNGTSVAGVYVSNFITMVLDNFISGTQQLQVFNTAYQKNQGIIVNSYVNFGDACSSSIGMEGYGFRDNNGVIEFKNKGGTWIALSSLI